MFMAKHAQKKIEKTSAEWAAQLAREQYHITREKGTERAFTGEYAHTKTSGVYRCVCCGAELFNSGTKFESGTGWPSFWAPVSAQNVDLEDDNSWFMRRTEVECSACGAHLGHVFDDGPRPTGQRFWTNSAALPRVPACDGDGQRGKSEQRDCHPVCEI